MQAMFKLDLSPAYKWPVVVRFVDESGRRHERTFHVLFRRLKKSEIEQITRAQEAGELDDAGFMREIVAGWDGIVDAHGRPIPCTDENIARLADIPEVATAIGMAWIESLAGGPRKN